MLSFCSLLFLVEGLFLYSFIKFLFCEVVVKISMRSNFFIFMSGSFSSPKALELDNEINVISKNLLFGFDFCFFIIFVFEGA